MLDAILEGSSESLLSLILGSGEGGSSSLQHGGQDSLTSLEKSLESLKKDAPCRLPPF